MVCSQGEIPTTHRNQMKLFNAFAAAAVIGISLIATTAVQARNGWIRAGTNISGETYYVRPLEFSGRYRKFLGTASHVDSIFEQVADCSGWRILNLNSQTWRYVMPGSVGENEMKIVCR